MSPSTPPAVVTREDRALFFDLFEISEGNRERVMRGDEDDRPQMQRIAAFRLTTQPPAVERDQYDTAIALLRMVPLHRLEPGDREEIRSFLSALSRGDR